MEDKTQKKGKGNLRKKDTEEIMPMDEEIIDEDHNHYKIDVGRGRADSADIPFEEEIIDDDVDDKPTKHKNRTPSRDSNHKTDPKHFKRLDTKSSHRLSKKVKTMRNTQDCPHILPSKSYPARPAVSQLKKVTGQQLRNMEDQEVNSLRATMLNYELRVVQGQHPNTTTAP